LYPDHAKLDYFLTDAGQRQPIKTPEDWQRRRRHVIAHVESVMGPLPRPATPTPLEPKLGPPVPAGNSLRRLVTYHTDSPHRRVSAWLFVPECARPGRTPAVLCLHQTTQLGKDEPAGLGGNPNLHYARQLADRGYVTLAPDYPSLGQYEYDFSTDDYASGSMKAIYDNVRAIDFLSGLEQVDPQRIGAIGHSLGGHNSIFTAVFDPRVKAVVSCCGFTATHRYMGGDLTGWSGPRYMPRIAELHRNSPDSVPFDFTELVAALAPRAFLAVAPLEDDNFDVVGVREVMDAARPIYRLYECEDRLQLDTPEAKHDFPQASRRTAYEFLDQHLTRRVSQ